MVSINITYFNLTSQLTAIPAGAGAGTAVSPRWRWRWSAPALIHVAVVVDCLAVSCLLGFPFVVDVGGHDGDNDAECERSKLASVSQILHVFRSGP